MERALVLRVLALATALAAPSLARAGDAAPAGSLEVRPRRVVIGMFFRGATVEVVARVPAGLEVAAMLVGHPERLELKRLARRGPVWASAGEITLEGVPSLYHLLTTAPLARLGSPAHLAEWRLGVDALVPAGAAPDVRDELRGLREHGGLFVLGEGELSSAAVPAAAPRMIAGLQPAAAAAVTAGSGERELRGAFRLPPNVPVGDYAVELLGIRDEQAYPLGTARVQVELSGGVLALRRFAFEHGLLYGIAASVIAILAGLGAGLVLGSRSDKGH